MKSDRRDALLGAALALLLSLVSASAQNYEIDWFTTDGGGGISSDAQYILNGTIGQPDAGTLSGGSYTLEGGFWPGLAMPSDGKAPMLLVQFSEGNVIISWSPPSSGFTLEQIDDLSSPSWSDGPAGNPTPPIPAGTGTRFYRLRKL